MTVSQVSAESTPRPRSHAVKTDQTDPRNKEMCGNSAVSQGQGIEHGCPARIGATVFDGNGPEGTIIGFTKHLVIYECEDGREGAQTYGMCTTPLAPPTHLAGPVGIATEQRPLNISAELLPFWPDDRYRRLMLKAAELMLEVEQARADSLERFIDDHDRLIDALIDFQTKAGEIDDNRLMVACDQAREAVQAKRNQTQDA